MQRQLEDPIVECFKDGFEAAMRSNETNPYPDYSEKSYSWQRGYNTALYGKRLNENKTAV